MTYGLVFGGGGVRGAYHIGVWKALLEMNIPISAVCGTSIGAINAALFVGSDLATAQKLWENIALSDVVSLGEMDIKEDLFDIKNILTLAKEIRQRKGLDMKPLKKLIQSHLDEEKVFSSDIDLGLVTYSITDKKECPVFKEDIPKGALIDYLLASACLPGFKSVVIDGAKFIDGSVSNTMPIDMITKKGIKDIIAINVKGIGVYKSTALAGANIISIECTKPYTGIMEFDTEGVKKAMSEGYYDTLGAFGKIHAGEYYLENSDYLLAKSKYSTDIIDGIFAAAKIFDIDNLRIWNFQELKDETCLRFGKMQITNELAAILSKNNFDKIASLRDEAQRLCLLVNLLQKEGFDFIKNHLDKVLGGYFKAASALMYFISK